MSPSGRARQVAGAVEPRPGRAAERIGDEALGGQLRPVAGSRARRPCAADVQLARHADRHRAASGGRGRRLRCWRSAGRWEPRHYRDPPVVTRRCSKRRPFQSDHRHEANGCVVRDATMGVGFRPADAHRRSPKPGANATFRRAQQGVQRNEDSRRNLDQTVVRARPQSLQEVSRFRIFRQKHDRSADQQGRIHPGDRKVEGNRRVHRTDIPASRR